MCILDTQQPRSLQLCVLIIWLLLVVFVFGSESGQCFHLCLRALTSALDGGGDASSEQHSAQKLHDASDHHYLLRQRM